MAKANYIDYLHGNQGSWHSCGCGFMATAGGPPSTTMHTSMNPIHDDNFEARPMDPDLVNSETGVWGGMPGSRVL